VSWIARVLVGLIRIYQLTLSAWLPSSCRFQPSCSQYGIEALRLHGAWRGAWFTARRIVRCRPGVPGGYDPVPFPDGPRDADTNTP
jgi:uncharacterized protein